MSIVRLTSEFSFEMAHALEGYDGACSQIHGHSYRLFVTVRGVPLDDVSSPKNGMLIDFKMLKQVVRESIIERFDHTFLIRSTQNNSQLMECLRRQFEHIEDVDYQPTCENLIVHLAEILKDKLPSGVELFSLKLHETANSFAEWFYSDNN